MKNDSEREYKARAYYDLKMGELYKLPDATRVKPSAKTVVTPLVGDVQSFVVETIRVKDEGDYLFLQYLDAETQFRIVLPPAITAVIARQRDAAGAKVRSQTAKQQAAIRKANGQVPGFLKARADGKPKKKGAASAEEGGGS